MIFALDANKERVNAKNAIKGAGYFCPGCGRRLTIKRGSINIPHFAHEKNAACDLLAENKMTEWHLNHQGAWPEFEREVILENGGKKHIADIRTGNVTVEFQHSPISYETLKERSNFYHRFGPIVWVFDLMEAFDCGRIRPVWYYNKRKADWEWKYSSRTLGRCDFDQLTGSDMYVFFQLGQSMFVQVLWNNEGVKYFGGIWYSYEQFLGYISELKARRYNQ